MQGLGGAIVTPLTLTILSAGVPPERRALALGAWGGVGGLAIAIGPVVGGAIAQGVNWHWIFWLNVPIGIVAVVLAYFRLDETHGPEGRLDLAGPRARELRPARRWSGRHPRQRPRLDRPADPRRLSASAPSCSSASPLGAPRDAPDAAAATVPQSRLHGGERASRS